MIVNITMDIKVVIAVKSIKYFINFLFLESLDNAVKKAMSVPRLVKIK